MKNDSLFYRLFQQMSRFHGWLMAMRLSCCGSCLTPTYALTAEFKSTLPIRYAVGWRSEAHPPHEYFKVLPC